MERKPTRFELRLPPELGDEIDDWRRKQPDIPSRAEAARRLIEIGLENERQARRE
jgi:metal-responsive CopG/Arc/MetJ family transcriptional regulator